MNLRLALCTVGVLLLVGCSDELPSGALPTDDPAAIRAAMRAVDASLGSSRIDEAVLIARRLVEVAPARSDVFELYGRTQIALAQTTMDPEIQALARKEAASAYARAIRVGEPSAGLFNAAGVTAQAAGDIESAIVDFQHACERDPSNAQHPLFLGLALMRAGRLADAIEPLRIAGELDPRSPWPISARSDLALRSGDAEGALLLAQQARALAPRNDELRVAEAKALRKLARHREILTLLLALPQESRCTEAVAWEIAAAYEGTGDPIGAAKAWEVWAQVSPRGDSALDAARRWQAAGDAIQAKSWQDIAARRGAGQSLQH